MAKTLQCSDVIPGCAAEFHDESEAGLLAQVTAHAEADHGMTEIDDETLAVVKGAITDD